LPALTFENLNSLEQLNLQNNKMDRLPEEVMEPIMDTLRTLDASGKHLLTNLKKSVFTFRSAKLLFLAYEIQNCSFVIGSNTYVCNLSARVQRRLHNHRDLIFFPIFQTTRLNAPAS